MDDTLLALWCRVLSVLALVPSVNLLKKSIGSEDNKLQNSQALE